MLTTGYLTPGLRGKFTVSDETCTLFKSALDYLKRGKRLNSLTRWDIQVTGWEGKLQVPLTSMACGCPVQATALLSSEFPRVPRPVAASCKP